MTDRMTELLRMLDERGIKYETHKDVMNRDVTKWSTHHGAFVFFAVEEEGKLFVETTAATEHSVILTPEQAIAATLGEEKAGGRRKTNYEKLFGTPERVAHTLKRFDKMTCAYCLLHGHCGDSCLINMKDYALFKWLRGDA